MASGHTHHNKFEKKHARCGEGCVCACVEKGSKQVSIKINTCFNSLDLGTI